MPWVNFTRHCILQELSFVIFLCPWELLFYFHPLGVKDFSGPQVGMTGLWLSCFTDCHSSPWIISVCLVRLYQHVLPSYVNSHDITLKGTISHSKGCQEIAVATLRNFWQEQDCSFERYIRTKKEETLVIRVSLLGLNEKSLNGSLLHFHPWELIRIGVLIIQHGGIVRSNLLFKSSIAALLCVCVCQIGFFCF